MANPEAKNLPRRVTKVGWKHKDLISREEVKAFLSKLSMETSLYSKVVCKSDTFEYVVFYPVW